MKKPKLKTKWSDKVTWQFCPKCGEAIYGSTVLTAKGWPQSVKVPKQKKKKK